MIKAIEKDISKRLKSLYNESEVAKRFFDRAAVRRRNPASTSVESAAFTTQSTKTEITDLFKGLEEFGVGTFKLGRRGHKSRIIWDYEIKSIGEAAQGKSEPIEFTTSVLDDDYISEDEEDENVALFDNDKGEGGEDEDMITHHFQLRSDRSIDFSLPKDLTNREADRLASFIKSLPFD